MHREFDAERSGELMGAGEDPTDVRVSVVVAARSPGAPQSNMR